YAVWYSVLPRLSRSSAAIVQLTVPVIAAVGGILFIGETLSWRLAIASVLILGGVAVAVTARPRRRGIGFLRPAGRPSWPARSAAGPDALPRRPRPAMPPAAPWWR